MENVAVLLLLMTSSASCVASTTTVKLLGGDGTYGAVQLTHDGQTGMLCDDLFQDTWHGAAVVCRMLGLAGAARYVDNGLEYNLYSNVTFVLDDVVCVGDESSIDDCNHGDWGQSDCSFKEQTGVICEETSNNVSVKLLGGDGSYGAVEVTYKGKTGMICDDQFRGNINGANVVCRMLGFPGAYNYTNGQMYNSNLNVSFMLDDLNCIGDEISIEYCSHRAWETDDCSDSEQAGVVCLPVVSRVVSVRLIGGDGTFGAVEVTYNGNTGMLCDDFFSGNIYGPNVVCRMLGFPRAERYTNGTSYNSNPYISFLLDDVKCSGSENSIKDCQHADWGYADCQDSEQAGVVCDTHSSNLVNITMTLLGGDGSYGAVQLTINGTTGMLCDDVFENNLNGPDVVCRMLGFSGAHNYTNGLIYTRGVVTPPFLLDDVTCQGHEGSLAECGHRAVGGHDCTASEMAGVVCLPRGLPVVG